MASGPQRPQVQGRLASCRDWLAVPAAMLIFVSPAYACRLHSIWRFPWPQRCPVELAVRPPLPHRPTSIEIPLPALTGIDWGDPADEQTLGRLLLRAAETR